MWAIPREGDSPEVLELKYAIEAAWQKEINFRKSMEEAAKEQGLLRAKLRIITENIPIGSVIYSIDGKQRGVLEVSHEAPYIWLRLISKEGKTSTKRLKFEEGMPIRLAE